MYNYIDLADLENFCREYIMKKRIILVFTLLAFITTTTSTFAAVSIDGLVGYYPFNGNADDQSGNGHHGTVYGATLTTDRFSNPGSAYSFDGIDDYISVDYSTAFQLPVFTVSAWILPTVDLSAATSPAAFVSRGEDFTTDHAAFVLTSHHPASSWANGISVIYEKDGREQVFDTNVYPEIGIWTHLVASRDASGLLSIYSDGSLIGQWSSTAVPTPNCFQDLLIGAYWYVPTPATAIVTNFFTGTIDDVMIFNRALSPDEIDALYIPDTIETKTYYIDAVIGDDFNNGLSRETPFATIQKGIDTAVDGDIILVYSGLYHEEINFLGKALVVQGISTGPAGVPVLHNPGDFAVSFYSGEGHDSILKNFIISNSFISVFIVDSSPTISNLTIVDNEYGIKAYAGSQPDISNSIFWNNTNADLIGCQARYSCTKEAGIGEDNIDMDPLFVDPNNGDYHLLSKRGRFWPEHDIWVLDNVTSPCIDGGDPATDPSNEPMPNGARINMGAYGRTRYASMSETRWFDADINGDGTIDLSDMMELIEKWIEEAGWSEE
jgi:hypothetical protein